MTYEQRLAIRKSLDGGAKNPKSIVLSGDYVSPDRRGSGRYGIFVKELLPFEKIIGRPIPSKPPKKRLEKTIKYNHFKLNYYGWDK